MAAGGLGSSGEGRASTSCRDAFSNVASRPRTARRFQPAKLSPVRTRTTSLVARLRQIAMPPSRPAIVPRRRRPSCSSSATGGGGGGTLAITAGSACAGGRREGANSGRSRVAVSLLSGMVHSGLPGAVLSASGASNAAACAPCAMAQAAQTRPSGSAAKIARCPFFLRLPGGDRAPVRYALWREFRRYFG